MTPHSSLGASSMYRWSACPGSPRQCEGVQGTTSSYAAEGTFAHEVAAWCLGVGLQGSAAELWDFSTLPEDMAAAVDVYLDHVKDGKKPGDVTLIEHKFDLSSVHPGCYGTADCVVWRPSEKLLVVMDYKHGAGIPVDVVNNPQLMYYGLGALLSCGYPAARVRMEIIQPRCDHPDGPVRAWEIDALDLLDFRADLIAYAKATEVPDAPLVPGDHCRFCPAAAMCPALAAKTQDVAKLEFGPALSYDPAKLKLALDSREVVKAWLKAVDEFAYAEAEAGRCPPGYKLVAKRAARKWRSDGEVIEHLQKANISDELIFAPRAVKSPAQMEKALGKDNGLGDFVVLESSGHALAPESDKRPPVKPDARAEFAPVSSDPLALPAFLDRRVKA